MKEMTIILDANVIKRNLSTCLKKTTLIGHIVELIETSKRMFIYKNNVNEGILALIARFKQQAVTVTTALFKKSYSMKNARKLREPKKYVQKIVRLIKFAQMKSVFNQLNIIYNDIEALFKKDLKKSTKMHTFDEYLQEMNDCKKIGGKLTKIGRIQNAYSQEYREKYQNNQIVFYRSNSKGNQTSIYQQFGNKYVNPSGQFQKNRFFQNYSAYRQSNSSQKTNRRSLSKSRQIMSSFFVSTPKYLTFENFIDKSNENNSTSNSANSNGNQGRGQRFNTYNNQRLSQFKYQNNQNQNNKFGKNRNQKIYFENENEKHSKFFEKNYNDDIYYDNVFYEEIMKNPKIEKSNDVQNLEPEEFEKINVHIAVFEFFLTCKCCEMIFYFNNKFHKHLKTICKSRSSIYFEEFIKNDMSIIEFIKKFENNQKYEFRFHQYATVKVVFTSTENLNDLCMNSETFMSLIDKNFIARKFSNIKIHITISFIKVKNIDKTSHDNFEYCYVDFYILEKILNESVIKHIKDEMHFVNDLKANFLMKTNIMISEKIFLNFHTKTFTIFICNQMSAPIKTNKKKKQSINRTVRIFKKTVIRPEKLKTIEMTIKKIKLLDDKDFNFHSIVNNKLRSKKGFFAHVINFDVKVIQIRNISNKSYVLSKKLKIEHVKDYNEKECYMMFSKKRHLAMIFKDSIMKNIREKIKQSATKSKLDNEIMIHEDFETCQQIKTITNEYQNVGKSIFQNVNISEKQGMKIKTLFEKISKSIKIFKLETENKKIIDKEFDNLQSQKKLKFFKKTTFYVFFVFVIGTIVYMNDKLMRKVRVMIDIREFNKIIEFDAYFMPLQSDIIFCIQDCKYISLMNDAIFFHQ